MVNLVAVLLLLAVARIGGADVLGELAPNLQENQPVLSDLATVTAIDVGQGMSTLILCGDQAVLIDAGERDQGDAVLDYLQAQGVTKLHTVIASHPHADHIGGLAKVLQTLPVEQVILPDLPEEQIPTTRTYEKLLDAIEQSEAAVIAAVPGETIALSEHGSLQLLGPQGVYDNLNDYSVSVRFTYGATAFLIAGDAEAPAEADILAAGLPLSSDVLFLGHHGSSSSSTPAYLDAVDADYYVAQCGKDNSYGHPHRETVEAVRSRSGILYRTDENGTVTFRSDGKTIAAECTEGSAA